MECSVCLNYWNSQTCVPKSLPCGHSYCSECLYNLINTNQKGITCPSCLLFHPMTEEEVLNLPKNFSLLALISDSMKIKQTARSPGNSFKDPQPRKTESPEDIERNEIDALAEATPLCEKHKMPVHSYLPKTHSLICDKCLPELQKEISDIKPIPRVCRELRHQLNRAKNVLWNKKAEIKKYKSVLQAIKKTSLEESEEVIINHFTKLTEILNSLEEKVKEIQRNAQQAQEEKINGHILVLEKMYDKMIDFELQLGSVNEYEDSDIVLTGKKIENLVEEISSKKIDIPGEGILIKPHIDSKVYAILETLLQSQVKTEVTSLQSNGRTVSVSEFSIPKKYWLCNLCGSTTSDSHIQCSKCLSVRNVESFPNILQNPEKVTGLENKLLKYRRQLEKLVICGRDLLNPEVTIMDGYWYIISSEWLSQWKAFIFNKPTKTSRVSSNPDIGVLPPGPISNYTLFLKDQQTPKSDLEKNLDYRGVNEFVWEAYHRFYGGGPIIVRRVLDIYADVAVDARLLDPRTDISFYRNLEKTHKELIEELIKLKKLECEKPKDGTYEEIKKKIMQLVLIEKKRTNEEKPQSPPKEVVKKEKPVFSFFIKYFLF